VQKTFIFLVAQSLVINISIGMSCHALNRDSEDDCGSFSMSILGRLHRFQNISL